jgi:ubiquinone biosynthesis monooxygenase Coq7
MRSYTFFDRCCLQFDNALKTLSGQVITTGRAEPAAKIAEPELSEQEQRHAAGLMRVNQVGEVCAQALYQGQAFTAKTDTVRNAMHQAAAEENDHLHWCNTRLTELGSRPSWLNPFWYTSSYAMGALAGWLGDKWSLGFVVETERQVEAHLAEHLQSLPEQDTKSRLIVEQMKLDEAAHAASAEQQGAAKLPEWVKSIMRCKAKVMTTTAYWV